MLQIKHQIEGFDNQLLDTFSSLIGMSRPPPHTHTLWELLG